MWRVCALRRWSGVGVGRAGVGAAVSISATLPSNSADDTTIFSKQARREGRRSQCTKEQQFLQPANPKRYSIMIRLTFVSIAAVLVGSSPTAGFVPLSARAAISTRPSNILKAATFGGDISFDVERARECADSFGECSIEDMERMKNGENSLQHGMICMLELKDHQCHVSVCRESFNIF